MKWLGSAHDLASVVCSLASVLAAHRIDLLSNCGHSNGSTPCSTYEWMSHKIPKSCYFKSIASYEQLTTTSDGAIFAVFTALERQMRMGSPVLLFCSQEMLQVASNLLPLPLHNKVLFLVPEIIGLSAWETYRASAAIPAVYQYLTAVSVPPLRQQLDVLRREPWSRRTNLTGLVVRCSVLEVIIPNDPPKYYLINFQLLYGDFYFISSSSLTRCLLMGNSSFPEYQWIFGRYFNLVCRKPKDGLWGNLDVTTSTWTGVLGELQRAEADVSVAPFSYSLERGKFFDFSTSIVFTKQVIIHKTPPPFPAGSNYTKQFSPQGWTLVAITFLVSILMMKLTHARRPSWSECVIRNFKIFCNMGDTPDRAGLHIWLITELLMVILLHVYYTAFLIAALSSHDTKLPVKDLNDIYQKRGEYTMGVIKDTSLVEEFKFAQDSLLADLWRDVISKDPASIASVEDQIKRTLSSSSHVFTIDSTYYFAKFKDCRLSILPSSILRRGLHYPVRRGFPAYPIINHVLNKLNEGGIFKRISKKWIDQGHQECTSSVPEALGLDATYSGFYPILAGTVAATLMLLVECCEKRVALSNFG
ncbi:Ionotropic receptor 183 [Hyalella azteca]|uniref:Ionotropic receptor 183 n=1 Tax=Hyalella azteca TaxID=294128 RepID=A0A6A0H3R3_HYAAZ|nr:Ionotropic receptor 183 [Hyalella azteca]